MTSLCETFGISRKKGYKWLDRYRKEGPNGLLEKSRTPHSNPNRVGFAENSFSEEAKKSNFFILLNRVLKREAK
ncbi:hypothetical protein A0128_13320 [Leptospira tipperaryensis]|uniref:DNA-binding domain-containing protein n=1 Tax=Leptospira tipperaryensis TaxID=2564040 RepID=A0A1D7UYU0_9LEPT|nr:hypothetical protein A0128_13320 [Leptospira tipperaryensis]